MQYPNLRIKHQCAQIVTADGSSCPYPFKLAKEAIEAGTYIFTVRHREWTVYERTGNEKN